MSKTKTQNMNIFQIFFKSCKIYLKNFIPLSKAMLFPVFGQLIGVILILYPTFIISKNLPKILSIEVITQNIILIYLGLLVITLPGFFVFTKAFWDYMIAMVSLNSMILNILKQGFLKDIQVHTRLIKLRSKEYIILLMLLSLIWLAGLLFPIITTLILFKNPVMVLALYFLSGLALAIISIYLSLSFQVFAFENISPVKMLKRSWELVEGNFWRIFLMIVATFIVTTMLIPVIFQAIIEKTPLMTLIIYPFKSYVALISDPGNISQILQSTKMGILSKIGDPVFEISKILALSTVSIIITAFMLPFGSACFTLLYFDITTRKSLKSKKK
ncbi:MAG: hypothetical protein V2B14_02990 [bacterium]